MKNCKSKCAAFAALAVVCIAALSYVVMLLWNHVVVSLADGIHVIDYCHAVGLLILSRILFGGFRGRHGHHHRHCGSEAMTADEQEKVRCGLFSRFRSKKDAE
ncbi:hypothetical protein [Methylophilus sp. Q8]|jgi:hypothetical protein|uniref:hypothetical protein n=1 Tax=Methylophilus sp. Q8 TaxID=1506586 RepID=UPI0009DD112B|nr:hypothetical protein [Methylophilus sp. Q8]